jgi:hypothetical protein
MDAYWRAGRACGQARSWFQIPRRGRTLQLAVEELRARPADHVLQRAWPVLVTYRPTVMQDFEELNDMNALQEALAIYDEWERRTKRTARAEQLLKMLADRFGPVPVEIIERVQEASSDELQRWARRMWSAQSLDDVFA